MGDSSNTNDRIIVIQILYVYHFLHLNYIYFKMNSLVLYI